MTKAKKAVAKSAPKKSKGSSRKGAAAKPTKDETVNVMVGSLLAGDNQPATRDLEYHYLTILGLMDKARTASAKVGDAKKKARESNVDVSNLMDVMKMTRMDPLELASKMRQQSALMRKLGLPVQTSLFELKYGSVEAQAKAEGWAAGKAGRTPDLARWPEGAPGHADYMRCWNDGTCDNVTGGGKTSEAPDDEGDSEE